MINSAIPTRVKNMTFAQFDLLNVRAAELRSQGHSVINLGQALPDFGPPPAVMRAVREALDYRDTHVYSPDAGLWRLREGLCDRLGLAHNAQVTPAEVIITAGANQAFMLAVMTLLDPDSEVVLPSPYFANHEMAIRAVGAVPIELPLAPGDGFSVHWTDIERSLTSRTRAVVLCNPSNPTGAVVSYSELTRILTELRRREILLVVDETYMHFVYGRGGHSCIASLPQWHENAVMISSFSKSFGMTGWRVGYMLADARVCDQAIKIQDAMIICAPMVAQIAADAAIREAWEYPLQFHPDLTSRRALVMDRIGRSDHFQWTPTEGGFFAFVGVRGCSDSATLARDLLDTCHVVTIPGSTFGRAGEGFLRLSYGSVTTGELDAALDRIERYFESTPVAPADDQARAL